MNPQEPVCHNPRCWVYGRSGEGHIVIHSQRDHRLIRAVLVRVRMCGPIAAFLLCTDRLGSYPRQALRCIRQPVRTGRRGRPRLTLPKGVWLIAQAINQYRHRRVRAVARRIVRGSATAVAAMLTATQGRATAVVNTAYIERLNATFRARLAPLMRRGRMMVRQVTTLEAGMWLVGTAYHFCTPHRSLRMRTPAQAAGLTDHR